MENIRDKICNLGQGILEGLQRIDSIEVYGPNDMINNVGIFSFTVKGRDPAAVAQDLESRYGIMTRIGLHCAPSAHRAIGTFPQGTIRAGIGYYTTQTEVAHLIQSLAGNTSKLNERCIVIFPSTHFAIRAERAAHQAGLTVRMVPVPRQISPDCNMGMETSVNLKNSLESVLCEKGIECNFATWSG